MDPSGSPVHDAKVNLARYSASFSQLWSVNSQPTDDSGVAAFAPERRWQMFLMIPNDLNLIYSWSWCVEATGFMASYENDLRSAGYSPVEEVVLEPSDPTYRCEWQCRPFGFDVFPAEPTRSSAPPTCPPPFP